jgi:hypothetical protein
MDARSNFTPGIAYDDLREWLALAERLGEVRTVRGASWQEDIGMASRSGRSTRGMPCRPARSRPNAALPGPRKIRLAA